MQVICCHVMSCAAETMKTTCTCTHPPTHPPSPPTTPPLKAPPPRSPHTHTAPSHLDPTARLLQLFSRDDLLVRKLMAVCPPSRAPSPGVSYCLEHVGRPAPNSYKRRTHERTIAEQNLQLYNRWGGYRQGEDVVSVFCCGYTGA